MVARMGSKTQGQGQGTDKNGPKRGLDLGSFTEFGVPSLPLI